MHHPRLVLLLGSLLATGACAGAGHGGDGSGQVESARAALTRAQRDEEAVRTPSRSSPAPSGRWAQEARVRRAERATGDARVALARARCSNDAATSTAARAYDEATARLAQAIDRCVAVQEDFERMQNTPGYSSGEEIEDETRADDAIGAVTRSQVAWRTALDAVTSRCP